MKNFFLAYVIVLSASGMALLGCHFAAVLTIPAEYLDKLIGLVVLPYTIALNPYAQVTPANPEPVAGAAATETEAVSE